MIVLQHAIGASARCRAGHAAGKPRRLVILVALLLATAGQAATGAESASDATSSRAARDEAVRNIPWKQMSPANRRVAQSVISDASIYRRLPTRIIDCDPDLFTFLLQHPEVVIDIWRVMGVSQVALNRSPDGTYQGTDGAGTTGALRFLFCNWGKEAQDVAVVYADGAYSGAPLMMPLKAQSVMFLRSGGVQETNGRHYITVRVDSFVRVEQLGVEIIAKTVQPWITKTADQNFIETMTFVSNFSRTAEKNPQGMQRLVTRLNTVDEPTRNELVALCFRTAERYSQQGPGTATSAVFAQRANFANNER